MKMAITITPVMHQMLVLYITVVLLQIDKYISYCSQHKHFLFYLLLNILENEEFLYC